MRWRAPQTIEVAAEKVTEVRVDGVSPRGRGAWAAVVRSES